MLFFLPPTGRGRSTPPWAWFCCSFHQPLNHIISLLYKGENSVSVLICGPGSSSSDSPTLWYSEPLIRQTSSSAVAMHTHKHTRSSLLAVARGSFFWRMQAQTSVRCQAFHHPVQPTAHVMTPELRGAWHTAQTHLTHCFFWLVPVTVRTKSLKY